MLKSKNLHRGLALFVMLALLLALAPMSALATTYNDFTIQFGDPNYDATWPESSMSLNSAGGTTYDAVYGDGTGNYYPNTLSLYAYYLGDNNLTLTSNTPTTIKFATYNADGEETLDTDGVMDWNQNVNWNSVSNAYVHSNLFAIKLSGSGSITIAYKEDTTKTVTINFSTPNSPSAGGGTTPSTVCGYLPVGQFARSNSYGWGNIYTDNTNVYSSDKTPKFVNGYVATGVSLGMLGGYVQFEFTNEIKDNPLNPYGIDFIVYGNAFNGNPEAGSVMVYGKPSNSSTYGWYNLAGSRHYNADTNWNVDISYIKIATAGTTIGNSSFTKAGVYYSTNYEPAASDSTDLVNAAISAADWYCIPTANTVSNPVASSATNASTVGVSLWPEIATNENYEQVWKMKYPDAEDDTVTYTDEHVKGVYWQTSGSAPVITYEGVTQVPDSDSTDYYQWGYADVRPNGSLGYGNAINPYASAASAVAGGDGFDLAWAVDTDGKPVTLTDVHFVRVYSAVLFNAGIFGETSAELCGIYVAQTSLTSNTTTDGPTSVKFTGTNSNTINSGVMPANGGTIARMSTIRGLEGSSLSITINADTGSNVFVNDVKLTESSTGVFTGTIDMPTSTQNLRVLVQKGVLNPYLFVII